MATKYPLGVNASGQLYEMTEVDMATKSPICLYDGALEELRAGDTLPTSGGTDPIVREYIAGDTWTKPAGLAYIAVALWGAGAGGGSGRRGAASTNRCGGSGATTARFVFRLIPASELPSTVPITIGVGGLGATAVTVDTTSGGNGGNGGDTIFGTSASESFYMVAKGGRGGTGGATATTVGAPSPASLGVPDFMPFQLALVAGGAGATGSPGNAVSNNIVASGGGGTGISSGNAVTGNAGSGGSIILLSSPPAGTTITNGGSGGLGGGTGTTGFNGSNPVTPRVPFTSVACTNGPGSGGGGGGQGNTGGTIAGGRGGNGGRAAGGGGGGASTNGANSGAGGDGGDGLCIIIEFYGA